jgi:PilZ domain
VVFLIVNLLSIYIYGGFNMSEKRDILRFRRRLTVCFGPDEANRRAFTEDISPTGMFIKTANVCNPNTVIRVALVLHDGQNIDLDARVMWAKRVPQNLFHLVKKSGMGVRILRFHSGQELYSELCRSYSG